MKKAALLSVFLLSASILSFGQYWYYTNFSEVKSTLGVTSLDSKAYFAGGNNGYEASTQVEIYDVVTEEWDEIINLSVPRMLASCATSGSKVFFAGGIDFYSSFECFDEVDIWNSFTQEWEPVEHLSIPRFDIGVVSYENKVLFAGGADMSTNTCYDVVDIYDTETGTWSETALSIARSAMGSAVAGDLAFFAGGFDFLSVTDRVDIYNFTTGTWSIATLSQARGFVSAVTVGNKVLFAGGLDANNTPSDRVDIYDASTGDWETATLSFPRAITQFAVATICNKAYFVGGGVYDLNFLLWMSTSDVIDIYDATYDSWSVDNLSQGLVNHGVAGAGNHFVVGGGGHFDGTTWWIVSDVEVFVDECPNVGVDDLQSPISDFRVSIYPNPVSSSANFEFDLENPAEVKISILNQFGQEVEKIVHNGKQSVNQV
ncbi:MAG: hypothetical protein HQ542_02810, partial [Bacteroidia bacterium]|nr:hypothetical protein [Bacteroidia bacterium]